MPSALKASERKHLPPDEFLALTLESTERAVGRLRVRSGGDGNLVAVRLVDITASVLCLCRVAWSVVTGRQGIENLLNRA